MQRARGGAALITTHQMQGNTKLDPIDPYPRSARVDDDAFIPMLSELTEAVHMEGAKISVLLSPGGGAQALGVPYDAGSDGVNDIPNVAPGTVECPVAKKKVRKLTVEEIKKTVEVYGKSCGRAKRAGFDAITIHAHCGYLIAEFLSPYFNDRDDEYGGNLENRARFLLELIAACRQNVGANFPIIVRLAVDEGIGDAGRCLPETIELCKMLEKAGVDALDCGAGLFMTMPLICPTVYHEKGCFTSMTAEIKKAVSIPVIAQGRLQDPEVAERVLADGKADFVAIGRGWIAEPDWVNKVKAGDLEGMRRCISCDHCIGDRISGNMTLRCTLYAMAGREHRFLNGYPKAEVKKTVAVIGAGPAGMEAAYRLAMRGHTVDLYDKADALCGGSQMESASTPPWKDNLKNIPNFYAAQFKRFDNIRIHLGVEITKDNLDEIKTDAVILATGAVPIVPPIPGLRENKSVLTANEVL
ncbi:MAG: FAD-dependent oxidoreductase, partial [Oscillospiraceae bacterium]|nr:FAD-dependent oxidoreductase [Oscillospiraceae bacterium]